MIRNWVVRLIFSCVIFIPISAHLTAQNIIDHPVGDEITADEAYEYKLFQDVNGFIKADFYYAQSGKQRYIMTYTWENDEGSGHSNLRFSEEIKNLIILSLYRQDSLNAGDVYTEELKVRINVRAGSKLIGNFELWNGTELTMSTEFGEQNIGLESIESVRKLSAKYFKEGEFFERDPNNTRLFFSPTGRSLKAGQGYFSDYELFFPGVAYGLTDRFTIGGGIFPFSTGDFFFGWLTPKLGIMETEDKAFAVGVLSLFFTDGDETFNSGILYGVLTLGEPDRAITLGLGYGYVESELADKPVLMIGGERRIGKRTKIITENWIIPDQDILFSLGFRWFGEKLAADFAIRRTIEMKFIGIPWLDIVVNF